MISFNLMKKISRTTELVFDFSCEQETQWIFIKANFLFCPEKAVSIPVAAYRCTFMTLSYFSLLIKKRSLKQIGCLFFFFIPHQ